MSIAGASPEKQVEYLLKLKRIDAQKAADMRLELASLNIEHGLAKQAYGEAQRLQRAADKALFDSEERFQCLLRQNEAMEHELSRLRGPGFLARAWAWVCERWNCVGHE